MGTTAPVFADTGGTVISLQTLASGANVRGTLALAAYRGGWFFMMAGFQGTTAAATGISYVVRRSVDAGVILVPVGPAFVGTTATPIRTTFAASGNGAASTSITVASTTGFVAGGYIFLDDTGNGGLANSEFARISKVTSSTVLLLDAPTQYAHNSVSAHVSTADIWPGVWMDGGCTVECIIDYGAAATGSTVACVCYYQEYQNDSY